MGETIEEKNERIEVIADLIKTARAPVKAADICELTGRSMSFVLHTMGQVKKIHPQVHGISGVGYIWKEEPPKEEPLTRFGDFKNNEGYPDPTAALAIKMMEPKDGKIDVGEIWNVSSAVPNYGNGSWLVLATYDASWVTCLEVYDPDKYAAPNSKYIVVFPSTEKNLYVDTRRLTTKPTKYFEEYVGTADEKTMERVKEKIGEAMALFPEDSAAHAPHDFALPVITSDVLALPKAGEGEIHVLPEIAGKSELEHQLELEKQRADIYERCFLVAFGGDRK